MVLSSENVGMQSNVMEESCSGLHADSKTLEGFIVDLGTLEQGLSNYWEGEDIDSFHTEFAKFKENLEELPSVIDSIANWGESVMESYNEVTNKSTQMFNEIFQGGK